MKSWFNQTTWSLCCRLYFTQLSAVVSDEGFCQQTTYIKVWTCFQASEFVPITDHLCCQHCVPSLCVESESFQPLVLLNLVLLKADPSDLQQQLLMEILLHWIQQLLFFPTKSAVLCNLSQQRVFLALVAAYCSSLFQLFSEELWALMLNVICQYQSPQRWMCRWYYPLYFYLPSLLIQPKAFTVFLNTNP